MIQLWTCGKTEHRAWCEKKALRGSWILQCEGSCSPLHLASTEGKKSHNADAFFSSLLWPRISRRVNYFSELLLDWFRIHVTEVNRRTHNKLLQVTVHGTTDCGRSSNQKCLVFPVCEGWRSSAHVFTTNTPLQGLFWNRFDCFQCKILLKMKYQQLFFIAACERTCLRTFKSNTTRGFAGLWTADIQRLVAGVPADPHQVCCSPETTPTSSHTSGREKDRRRQKHTAGWKHQRPALGNMRVYFVVYFLHCISATHCVAGSA